MDKIAVSLAEAEKLTSVSRFTLRRQIKRGVLKVARVGRRLVIPLTELEKLVRPTRDVRGMAELNVDTDVRGQSQT